MEPNEVLRHESGESDEGWRVREFVSLFSIDLANSTLMNLVYRMTFCSSGPLSCRRAILTVHFHSRWPSKLYWVAFQVCMLLTIGKSLQMTTH